MQQAPYRKCRILCRRVRVEPKWQNRPGCPASKRSSFLSPRPNFQNLALCLRHYARTRQKSCFARRPQLSSTSSFALPLPENTDIRNHARKYRVGTYFLRRQIHLPHCDIRRTKSANPILTIDYKISPLHKPSWHSTPCNFSFGTAQRCARSGAHPIRKLNNRSSASFKVSRWSDIEGCGYSGMRQRE